MSNNNRHGIYLVSNPAMPGLLKIGFTKKTIGQRLAQLNTTGVPAPFRCEAFFSCDRLELVESRIHSDLEKFRYRGGREFFKISVEEATTVAQKHAARYPLNINDPPEKWKTKKELAREKSQALLKAIINAKTRDEIDRLEKTLRYYYVKGVDELGGKGEFKYLEAMANAVSCNISKEQKK
ncbi:MAG: GIY-YIG nuclease family protein [Proteobacteria bacterium]|nr:GIY-YIG nuclease family protein [Pseudomonadota bacterium]